MIAEILEISVGAVVLSALFTGVVRKFALSHALIDIPNQRSSHTRVTPRGGGISIVVVTNASLLLLVSLGRVHLDLIVALLVGGGSVATIGFLDDRGSVSIWFRLAVHVGSAIWALAWLGGLPAINVIGHVVSLGWAGDLLAIIGIVWALNLFNFMDGIDGIAASEATFIAISGALLTLLWGRDVEVSMVGIALGSSCLGFLVWNWAPAKIFLGDVGSGYLGYVIAVLAVAAARVWPIAIWVWLMLGGAFFVDATVTLLRRVARCENAVQGHRSHAYQRMARRWGSHSRVTVAITIVNLIWLLPFAILAIAYPRRAVMLTLVALAAVFILALWAGSGRREQSD